MNTSIPPVQRAVRLLVRIAIFLTIAALVGSVLKHSTKVLERDQRPAGMGRGFLHGALMPCALPNLLVGNDVPIYAQNNTGLSYKLGYTLGVNACGAIFFGIFFWRVNRWRKSRRLL